MTTTDAVPAARRDELVRGLLDILPAASVLHDAERLRPYECDGLSAYRHVPLAAALPATVAEVQAVMRLCHRLTIPVGRAGMKDWMAGTAMRMSAPRCWDTFGKWLSNFV